MATTTVTASNAATHPVVHLYADALLAVRASDRKGHDEAMMDTRARRNGIKATMELTMSGAAVEAVVLAAWERVYGIEELQGYTRHQWENYPGERRPLDTAVAV